ELIKHIFKNYAQMTQCRNKQEQLILDTEPLADPANFAGCLKDEFPAGAASIKTAWRRINGQAPKLTSYKTDASALQNLLTSAQPDWESLGTPAQTSTAQGLTMETTTGARFLLSGMHIMTKELRHWVW